MLSPLSECESLSPSRPPTRETGTDSDGGCLTVVHSPLRNRRKVDTVMANIEVLVDEIVKKREAWGKSAGTKRRLPIDTAINVDNYAKLREHIADQLGEDDAKVPNSPEFISMAYSPRSLSPDFEVFTPGPWSPAFSNTNTPLSSQLSFPFDLGSSPIGLHKGGFLSPGWSPLTAITVTPPRSRILDNIDNQQLFQYYLDFPAQRLADTSPSYIDLFRKYVPAMAHESPALMEGLLGLAGLQRVLAEGEGAKPSIKTIMHYQKALELHQNSLQDPESLTSDIPLATSLILSHYELWGGELIKLGVHMLGCRDIIELRGKAAHMTPVGRALLAAFRRLDVSSSLISGNPSFQTDDWWTIDPLSRTPILDDAPPLLAADAAFSKLCVICSRLCHLKAWIIRRRREVHQAIQESCEEVQIFKRESLEAKISQKISKLEDDLEDWLGELPPYFMPLDGEQEDEEEEEDVNVMEKSNIVPKLYKHKAIGLVVAYGIGVRLQLYRLRYPDVPVLNSELGSQCHKLLRIYAGLPTSCDGAMTAPLFAVGIELRQKQHQEWFLSSLDVRIAETGFHALKFLREGVCFAYMKLEGIRKGRFIKIKEGAAARIEGVSENLWSAEGMLCSMEALSLYEPDISPTRKTFTFQGDFDLAQVDLENQVPYESATPSSSSSPSSRETTMSPERSLSPDLALGRHRKKSRSVTPGPSVSPSPAPAPFPSPQAQSQPQPESQSPQEQPEISISLSPP